VNVTDRAGVIPAVRAARELNGPCLINFRVEKEDAVYPMVPAGADLQEMIRRPQPAAAGGK
jgi:acetolactate synthase-1/2/3 large subunit